MPKFAANQTDERIGRRIKRRRDQLKLTQADLGNAVGVSLQQIQKYERGTNKTTTSMLIEIAGFLSVPISYFIDDDVEDPAHAHSKHTAMSECPRCSKILALFGEARPVG